MLRIGQKFPNPSVLTTLGLFELHKFFNNSWAILFSHPKNFTPVCTTELARLAKLQSHFDKRETKIICLSVDKLEDHQIWQKDIEEYSKYKINFPIIADCTGEVAEELGVLDHEHKDLMAARAVYIIAPDKNVKAVICYPASTGRNFDEIIRLLDALQLHWKRPDVVTPSDWKQGDKVLVKPGEKVLGDAEEPCLPSNKKYLHFINC